MFDRSRVGVPRAAAGDRKTVDESVLWWPLTFYAAASSTVSLTAPIGHGALLSAGHYAAAKTLRRTTGTHQQLQLTPAHG
ncbi:hypothetical protein [Mycobacterium sp.]|uniref:hypothetical protein n=1 Tax=Mycobacterium sp. TaxID=1785 RepID=UPI0025DFEAE9|nr:hypothetical protein [Mycobacterium sp.]MBW0015116.1 hypothetical protein [Mycobacterium sp.]